MAGPPLTADAIKVEPWPSERPLTIAAFLIAGAFWLVLAFTIIGLFYALLLVGILSLSHVLMIAHIRGNSVRLGPNQFPELHQAVEQLARRVGLPRAPEAYLMQAGGVLNAFATKYFRGNFIVLYSDLLDACGANTGARDMIIAHELGHVRSGHLNWLWFLFPAYLFPWPGRALSRAREYTCDRYGLAGAGGKDGALTGLTILAAGGRHGPLVNRAALVDQADSLGGLGMRWAQMYMSHPPLVRRIAALDPSIAKKPVPIPGATYAIATVGAAALVALGVLAVGKNMVDLVKALGATPQTESALDPTPAPRPVADTNMASAKVNIDFMALRAFITAEVTAGRTLPADAQELYQRYEASNGGDGPTDPFDGARYGYVRVGEGYKLVSSGPDGLPDTDDDLIFQSDRE